MLIELVGNIVGVRVRVGVAIGEGRVISIEVCAGLGCGVPRTKSGISGREPLQGFWIRADEGRQVGAEIGHAVERDAAGGEDIVDVFFVEAQAGAAGAGQRARAASCILAPKARIGKFTLSVMSEMVFQISKSVLCNPSPASFAMSYRMAAM